MLSQESHREEAPDLQTNHLPQESYRQGYLNRSNDPELDERQRRLTLDRRFERMDATRVCDALKEILTKRFSILSKYESSLMSEQRDRTPKLKERLAAGETVTLAKRIENFSFRGGKVNIHLEKLPHTPDSWFQPDQHPTERPEFLARLDEEDFVTRKDIGNGFYSVPLDAVPGNVSRHPAAYGIVLTHETYGPDKEDYELALLGHENLLHPLPGINGSATEWEAPRLRGLEDLFQRKFPIRYEYFDNHYAGW